MPAHKRCLFTGAVEEERRDVYVCLVPVSCLKKCPSCLSAHLPESRWLFRHLQWANFGRFWSWKHESHDSVTIYFLFCTHADFRNWEMLIKETWWQVKKKKIFSFCHVYSFLSLWNSRNAATDSEKWSCKQLTVWQKYDWDMNSVH